MKVVINVNNAHRRDYIKYRVDTIHDVFDSAQSEISVFYVVSFM